MANGIWRWLARLPRLAGILPPACRDYPDTECRGRDTCDWLRECLLTCYGRQCREG